MSTYTNEMRIVSNGVYIYGRNSIFLYPLSCYGGNFRKSSIAGQLVNFLPHVVFALIMIIYLSQLYFVLGRI